MFYENNWESLNSRPVPAWFGKAKFGIFIHWGLYSVPAYTARGSYAEWYKEQIWKDGEPAKIFHEKTYGQNFKYEDFAGMFKAELFDPDEWKDLFIKSGAKYICLVTKHHDGFTLYPSEYTPFWNSVDIGPHRDIVGELKKALHDTDIRFGLYHSIYEWHHPLMEKPEEYAIYHLVPMLKELINKYEPDLLFTDGEWDYPSDIWHSTEFLTWLFNESPVKDRIVVNDRWGSETRGKLGGYFSTEYGEIYPGKGKLIYSGRPFEECRGIGKSFGFNRIENIDDYMSAKELLEILCTMASRGGNLLLNIGPAADGTIPVIMQERLIQIGKWLSVNGEAIYDTEKYCDPIQEQTVYTQTKENIYAIIKEFPFESISFPEIPYNDVDEVSLLGFNGKIKKENENGHIKIIFPNINPDKLRSENLYTVRMKKS